MAAECLEHWATWAGVFHVVELIISDLVSTTVMLYIYAKYYEPLNFHLEISGLLPALNFRLATLYI